MKNNNINILILSCGTRNKIVQYFKESLNGEGKVIATDCSPYAPALLEADKYYIVPRITEENYLDIILDICKKENISGVLSLIDPELSLLAKNRRKFEAIKVKVIGSSYEKCERCLDKYKMFQWLKEHGFKCAKSYLDKEEFYRDMKNGEISYPVFVKPVRGSASIAISKVYDCDTIELLFRNSHDLMIQEYLDGQEIGVDCYIDMISRQTVSIFTKYKLAMRAGETDKAISFKDERLFELINRFVNEFGFEGQIDIDIFKVANDYYISEVNPRFGGGYPHAYECGVNHMKLILNNLRNVSNSVDVGNYKENMVMMKYNELKMLQV